MERLMALPQHQTRSDRRRSFKSGRYWMCGGCPILAEAET